MTSKVLYMRTEEDSLYNACLLLCRTAQFHDVKLFHNINGSSIHIFTIVSSSTDILIVIFKYTNGNH